MGTTTSASASERFDKSPRTSSPREDVVVSIAATGRELVRAREIAQQRNAHLRFAHADELLQHQSDLPALVVVAARETHFGRPLAERAHARLRSPVLQVRSGGPTRYSHTILATDVGSALDEMVAAARWVAPGIPMLFLHAYENPFESMLYMNGAGRAAIAYHRRESAKASRERVREHMKRWDLEAAPLRLEHGAPRFVLRRVPRRVLLVIHRGRSRLKHMFFGSVTRWALEETTSDVLVV